MRQPHEGERRRLPISATFPFEPRAIDILWQTGPTTPQSLSQEKTIAPVVKSTKDNKELPSPRALPIPLREGTPLSLSIKGTNDGDNDRPSATTETPIETT